MTYRKMVSGNVLRQSLSLALISMMITNIFIAFPINLTASADLLIESDWIIDDDIIIEDEIIDLHANLIILTGYTLTLINCELIIHSDISNIYTITVEADASFILDGSEIYPKDDNYLYDFDVYGNVCFMRSTIQKIRNGLNFYSTVGYIELIDTVFVDGGFGVMKFDGIRDTNILNIDSIKIIPSSQYTVDINDSIIIFRNTSISPNNVSLSRHNYNNSNFTVFFAIEVIVHDEHNIGISGATVDIFHGYTPIYQSLITDDIGVIEEELILLPGLFLETTLIDQLVTLTHEYEISASKGPYTSNNINFSPYLSQTVAIKISGPEVSLVNITVVPENPLKNTENTITAFVNNSGSTNLADIKVNFYVATSIFGKGSVLPESPSFSQISTTQSLSLLSGENKSVSVEWQPNNAGMYVVKVIVDPTDEITELNENNNQHTIFFTIHENIYPFVIYGYIYEQDGITPIQGADVSIFRVNDQNDKIDIQSDAKGRYIANALSFQSYTNGEQITIQVTYNQQSLFSNINAFIDLGGTQTDFIMPYSSGVGGGNTPLSGVDLIVSSIQIFEWYRFMEGTYDDELFMMEGENVIISIDVTNIGDTPTSDVYIDLYNGLNKICDSLLIENIDADSTQTVTVIYTVPQGQGPATLHAIVDPENNITEIDENNNELSREITVISSFIYYIQSGWNVQTIHQNSDEISLGSIIKGSLHSIRFLTYQNNNGIFSFVDGFSDLSGDIIIHNHVQPEVHIWSPRDKDGSVTNGKWSFYFSFYTDKGGPQLTRVSYLGKLIYSEIATDWYLSRSIGAQGGTSEKLEVLSHATHLKTYIKAVNSGQPSSSYISMISTHHRHVDNDLDIIYIRTTMEYRFYNDGLVRMITSIYRTQIYYPNEVFVPHYYNIQLVNERDRHFQASRSMLPLGSSSWKSEKKEYSHTATDFPVSRNGYHVRIKDEDSNSYLFFRTQGLKDGENAPHVKFSSGQYWGLRYHEDEYDWPGEYKNGENIDNRNNVLFHASRTRHNMVIWSSTEVHYQKMQVHL